MSIENNLKKMADSLDGIYKIMAGHFGEPDAAEPNNAKTHAVESEKPKRGRPPLDKEKEPAKEKDKVTSKELYDLAVKATKELGVDMKTLKDILAVYGVKTVNDVPENKLEEAMGMLNDAITEASAPPENDENPF